MEVNISRRPDGYNTAQVMHKLSQQACYEEQKELTTSSEIKFQNFSNFEKLMKTYQIANVPANLQLASSLAAHVHLSRELEVDMVSFNKTANFSL